MRVLLSTIGTRGDVQPLVALAIQLKSLGEEVHFCVPPDFRGWIESLGMSVTPIGAELRTATAASGSAPSIPLSEEQRRHVTEMAVATQFETVGRAARGCDMIVAATFVQIAARSIAEKMGIPYVFIAYSPNVLPSPHHAPSPLPPLPAWARSTAKTDNRVLWTREARRFNDRFGPALNAHRKSIGLAPVSNVRRHIFTDRPWLAADPALAPWPDAANKRVFQTGAWLLKDDAPLVSELDTFLDAGEPPVYVGFGSMRVPRELTEVIVETARALGRRSVVCCGWADFSLTNNEPDCLVISDVNQQALFKRVAAVVHHGGAGTTTSAALAGAPQVVIPLIYDQRYWGQRVQQLGIGTVLPPAALSMDALKRTLKRALRPDVAVRAKSFASTLADDGVQKAALAVIAAGRKNSIRG
jgi:vancomycin aglycone glucosyltransferase